MLEILDSQQLALMRITPEHYTDAGHLHPPELRSLEAIHLQAARLLGDELDGIVTYDQRFANAAERQGHHVVTPM
jgi:predicted nucleic acid-binding protein